MRIIVDGDATPRSARNICTEIGKQFDIPVQNVSEIDRSFNDDGTTVEDLEGRDYKIAQMVTSSDIVVTMDYTLASQVYGTALAAIHPRGFIYSAANMDELLYHRYVETKQHKQGSGRALTRRSMEEDKAFTSLLLDLVAPIDKNV